MGTTLDEPLYYIPSTRLLACIGLRFDINLHTYIKLIRFLAPLPGRSFFVDIDNNTLRYYFGSIFLFIFLIFFNFNFYSVYTSACNSVSAAFVCGFRRLICVHVKARSR